MKIWLLKVLSLQPQQNKPHNYLSTYKTITSPAAACLISSWSYSINASGLN